MILFACCKKLPQNLLYFRGKDSAALLRGIQSGPFKKLCNNKIVYYPLYNLHIHNSPHIVTHVLIASNIKLSLSPEQTRHFVLRMFCCAHSVYCALPCSRRHSDPSPRLSFSVLSEGRISVACEIFFSPATATAMRRFSAHGCCESFLLQNFILPTHAEYRLYGRSWSSTRRWQKTRRHFRFPPDRRRRR